MVLFTWPRHPPYVVNPKRDERCERDVPVGGEMVVQELNINGLLSGLQVAGLDIRQQLVDESLVSLAVLNSDLGLQKAEEGLSK